VGLGIAAADSLQWDPVCLMAGLPEHSLASSRLHLFDLGIAAIAAWHDTSFAAECCGPCF